MAFDAVYIDGRDLRPDPLTRRRAALEHLIDRADFVFPARRLPPHGLAAWDIVKERGYEGLVAKDERSPYRPGRTRSWLKVKVRYEGVFVVGGILGWPDTFDGLLVGERVGRRLLFRGVVGWGVTRDAIEQLLRRCRVVDRSPFHNVARARRAMWLQPCTKIAVTYNEMMEERLRDRSSAHSRSSP